MLWILALIYMTAVLSDKNVHKEPKSSRLVYIEQGPVRGYRAPDGEFFVFYGVPYATAPTGTHRYKEPLPPPVWSETLEAVDRGIICPQTDYMSVIPKNKTKQEDCLIATIYVPDVEKDNISVVVYVHGGGYLIGFGDYVTPRNFAKTKRVIIVTFNYRLAAHGFLCLGTKDIPGNAGMKDQIALLRWVKKNIASFGGNPNDVTLAGYSAGSAAVDALMLSKMSKGLFTKVIPESGISIAAYNVQSDPLENAKKFAKWLNFTNIDDLYALEEFYKTSSYEFLNSINTMNLLDQNFIFSPCVERDTGVERFLEESPFDILTNGNYEKLPLLYGFTTMEGLFRIPLFNIWKDQMNAKFSDFLPVDLQFQSEEEKELTAKEVKEFYFGTKPVSAETILGYVDYFTDMLVNYSTLRAVKLHLEAGHHKIFLYEYIHTDEDTIIVPYTNVRGADHCAQTWAVLDGLNLTHTSETLISDNLKKMKRVTRELWLNFMATSNPIPEGSPFPTWPTTEANAIPHMALDINPTLRIRYERRLEDRYKLWDKIYTKHYRNPVAPPPPPY